MKHIHETFFEILQNFFIKLSMINITQIYHLEKSNFQIINQIYSFLERK